MRVTAIFQRIEAMQPGGVLGQLIRFVISGGIATIVYACAYLVLADKVFPRGWATVAVPPAFVAGAACGFFLHSGWSFKGHGTRDSSGRQHAKFVLAQLTGMLLNTTFTWVITVPLHGPNWLPLIPSVTITPLVSFMLNRQWVFA